MSVDVPAQQLSGLPVVMALNSEWHRRLAFLDIPASWGSSPALEGLGSVREILGLLRGRSAGVHLKDEVLLALATAAVGGGPQAGLARRVLLQAMLGKAVLIARGLACRFSSPAEAATHVVGCMYEVIANYPVQRRPGKVATNVALDTLKLSLASYRTDQAVLTASLEGLAELTDPEAEIGVSLVREALELGVIDADDELVAETVLAPRSEPGPRAHLVGLLSAAVSGRHLTLGDARALAAVTTSRSATRTADTVRQRRSRARARLRVALPALQAA